MFLREKFDKFALVPSFAEYFNDVPRSNDVLGKWYHNVSV